MTEDDIPAKRHTSVNTPQRAELAYSRAFRLKSERSTSAAGLLPLRSGRCNEQCLMVYAVPTNDTTLRKEKNRTARVEGPDSIGGTNIMAESSGSVVKTI